MGSRGGACPFVTIMLGFYFILFYFILFYFILFYFILFYFYFCFILFYFGFGGFYFILFSLPLPDAHVSRKEVLQKSNICGFFFEKQQTNLRIFIIFVLFLHPAIALNGQ